MRTFTSLLIFLVFQTALSACLSYKKVNRHSANQMVRHTQNLADFGSDFGNLNDVMTRASAELPPYGHSMDTVKRPEFFDHLRPGRLKENALGLQVPSQEQLYPSFQFGLMVVIPVYTRSTTSRVAIGKGLGGFGEYRFSQSLALQLGLQGNMSELFNLFDDATYVIAAPLHVKWYIIDSFNIHLGPQLNYISDPKEFTRYKRNLFDENNVTLDLSFGVGYNWGQRIVVNLGYAKGLQEIGKDAVMGGVNSGIPLKVIRFRWGWVINFSRALA